MSGPVSLALVDNQAQPLGVGFNFWDFPEDAKVILACGFERAATPR